MNGCLMELISSNGKTQRRSLINSRLIDPFLSTSYIYLVIFELNHMKQKFCGGLLILFPFSDYVGLTDTQHQVLVLCIVYIGVILSGEPF